MILGTQTRRTCRLILEKTLLLMQCVHRSLTSENPRCLSSSSTPSTRISDWMCWVRNCMKPCANAMADVHAIQDWRSTITSQRSLPSTRQTNNSDAKFWNLLNGDAEKPTVLVKGYCYRHEQK